MSRRHSPAEPPWASFADALSGMLFVFIITTFWFAWQLAIAKQAAEQAQADSIREREQLTGASQLAQDLTRRDAADSLTDCLAESEGAGRALDAIAQSAEARVLLYLADGELWFESGERILSSRHAAPLARVRHCLERLIDLQHGGRLSNYRLRVYLEGHTDAVPIDNTEITNWELSALRATSVLRQVVFDSPIIQAAQARDDVALLAVGMADRHPAWRRICDRAKSVAPDPRVTDANDHKVCTLTSDVFSDTALIALRGMPDVFALDAQCRPVTRELHEANDADLVRWWANRCTARGFGSRNPRLELLRRVDIRLELTPKVNGQAAPGAEP